MIKGVHTIFYSSEAEALREFIRDKLGFPCTDVGDGWLIFDAPEAELGCHPSEKPFHELSFYCDDIKKTVSELSDRGVEFTDEIQDEGYGLVTHFAMPGNFQAQLYQPLYAKGSK